MVKATRESETESAKESLLSRQGSSIPSASLINLRLAHIRSLAGKGLIKLRKI
ncbi:MAG: hypothetical protein ACXAB4_03370 [Candidatus Hodarchaeales archaeon]